MKLPRAPHAWRLSPRAAIRVQERLRRLVIPAPAPGELRFIAGLDAAFSADGASCLAAVVLWDRRERAVVEVVTAMRPLRFPYVPGLLSFREAPALLAALRRLRHPADALMCDGQGLAHPRRFGIACHLGVICDLPSVGCAKSRLTGDAAEPGPRAGDAAPLCVGDEQVGWRLRTRDGGRPLYVSVGHRIGLDQARALVLDCCAGHRLPEPTRRADRAVAAFKRSLA